MHNRFEARKLLEIKLIAPYSCIEKRKRRNGYYKACQYYLKRQRS